MNLRLPVSRSRYIVAIGIVFALATTQPCLGNKDEVGLAEEIFSGIDIPELATPFLPMQLHKINEKRYLDATDTDGGDADGGDGGVKDKDTGGDAGGGDEVDKDEGSGGDADRGTDRVDIDNEVETKDAKDKGKEDDKEKVVSKEDSKEEDEGVKDGHVEGVDDVKEETGDGEPVDQGDVAGAGGNDDGIGGNDNSMKDKETTDDNVPNGGGEEDNNNSMKEKETTDDNVPIVGEDVGAGIEGKADEAENGKGVIGEESNELETEDENVIVGVDKDNLDGDKLGDRESGGTGSDEKDGDNSAGEEHEVVEQQEGHAAEEPNKPLEGGGEIGDKNSEPEKSKPGQGDQIEASTPGNSPPPLNTHDYSDEDYGEPAVGKYAIGFLVLVGVVIYFKCCRKSGGGMPMPPSINRSHGKGKYETIATHDVDGGGDDWGWDDQNNNQGDVELAHSSNRSMPIPAPSGLTLKQRSPSVERRDYMGSPGVSRPKGLQLPPTHTIHSLAPPTMQSAPPMITTLGTHPPSGLKATARKPKEDDIFASMGLAAQPKFQTTKPAAPFPAANNGRGAAAPPPVAATAASSFDNGGADWGNDDDLDDLFDD